MSKGKWWLIYLCANNICLSGLSSKNILKEQDSENWAVRRIMVMAVDWKRSLGVRAFSWKPFASSQGDVPPHV